MDELGLKSTVRKVKYHSYKGEVGKTAANVISRIFSSDRPYHKLVTDVSQMTISGRKIYLSPILDMFNGEVLTYTISEAPNLEMVTEMLNRMYKRIGATQGVVLHSDQGWHYQHAAYQRSISHMGDSQIRGALYMASMTAIRTNTSCKEFFYKLRKNGKPGKLALTAVSNKLIRQAFAVVKSGVPYIDGYVSPNPMTA